MIKTGAKMNIDFTFKVVKDGEEQEVKFADLLDKRAIVSVYMKNNTSSCDRQTVDLAEHSEWFEKNGYNLIAISKDGCKSHQNYAKKHGINYTLASDPSYKFSEATDSGVENKMYGKTLQVLHVQPLLLIQMVLFWHPLKKLIRKHTPKS